MLDYKQIGQFIREQRKKFSLTQEQLAEQLFVADRLFQNGNVVNVCQIIFRY